VEISEGILMVKGGILSNESISNLLDTYIPQRFERQPISFQKQHRIISKPFENFFYKKSNKILTLKKTIIRNRFLYNCAEFTQFEPIEYLIVGYGKKRGVGTDIKHIQINIGERDTVGIPKTIEKNIEKWSNKDLKNEIIIFHNHPRYWLNVMFSTPLPSGTDRDAMLAHKFNLSYIARTLYLKGGGIRFYLSDNFKVNEFRIPRVKTIIEGLKSIGLLKP
jgi:hypothetical protein